MTRALAIETEAEARDYVASWADATAMARIERFAELLLAENQRQNLISKGSEAHLWQRHFADSVQLLEHVPRETYQDDAPGPWLDLGSGAGFPGLIIAIVCPSVPVVLVESRSRRAQFLGHCVEELGLGQCRIVNNRLERMKPFPAWVISARAFAPLDRLLRLSAPFSTSMTRYLLPKGGSAAHELDLLKPSIRSMFHVEQSLTDRAAGIILRV